MSRLRRSLRRVPLQGRLSSLAALAVGVTVAVAALVSYVAVSRQLYGQVDAQLSNDVTALTGYSPGGTFSASGASRLAARFRQDVLQVVGPDGLVFSPAPDGTAAVPITAGDRRVAATTGAVVSSTTTRTAAGTTYRVETVGGRLQTSDGTPLAIQVAHPISDIQRTLDELRLVLLTVALGGMAVAVALGYAVARATIRPVERLTAAAEHVAATQDLEASIDDDGGDELARLAHAFNAMLAALAASRRQQAQLVSDAGHELRTPLTSLRTNIEVLLRVDDLPAADREELLADVRGQLEELTTLIGDLVELGRHEETRPEPTEVRLDHIVERALERARRRAGSVTFDAEVEAGSVLAAPPLLERAVLNVLDNAAKFSPPGGHVEVALRRLDRWVLDVRDHGPGIAPEDLPHVFDRFYRAQAARSLPGSGLGLAIVAQVVADHGGRVAATAPPDGGTLVRIELPVVAEAEVGPTGLPLPPAPPDPGLPGLPGPGVAGGATGAEVASPGGEVPGAELHGSRR